MRAFRSTAIVLSLAFALVAGSPAQLVITPTTTLAAETANNTSASDTFAAQANGNPAPANVSKLPLRNLLYPGASTRLYAHFMPWFGGANHMWVGYRSDDRAQVARQVADMMSRGFDGAIVDWYGPNFLRENTTTLYLRDEAEKHGGRFTFAVMEDVGALKSCANTAGCDVTRRLIDDLNYAYYNYYGSPAYLRIGGRPVVFFFGVDAYPIDWARARAGVYGNPLFIFRNSGAFTHAQTNGGFSWVGFPSSTSDIGLAYLTDFYNTAARYPTLHAFGSGYPGFDDSLAAWMTGSPRIVKRKCGETFLATMAHTGQFYSSLRQLPALQVVTWNDYEEGSQVETGIDNCVSVSAALAGGVLQWTVSGPASTIDHFNVFISSDGQNLMKLTVLDALQRSLDLAAFNLASGSYTLYVQAYGKPSLRNAMSNAVAYQKAAAANQPPVAALSLSPGSGTAPLGVTASTAASSDPDGAIASSSIAFGDGTVKAGPTAAHSYAAAGRYTVTATVTDDKGATATVTGTVDVAAPSVTITSPAEGATVTNPVRVTGGGSSGAEVWLTQIYVDGAKITEVLAPSIDTTLTLAPGTRYITVQCYDRANNIFRSVVTVTVAEPNQPPIAALSLSAASGIAPLAITASTSGSSDPDGAIVSSSIDFGDGTVKAGPSAAHSYAAAGRYTVRATVTDDKGAASATTATLDVAAPSVTIASPAEGATVSTQARVTASGASGAEVWLTQIYVDGVKVTEVLAPGIDTTLALSPGSHQLTVQCYDRANNIFRSVVNVTAVAPNQAPTARLSVTPASGIAALTVTASAAASSDSDGSIVSSQIDFGDGTVKPGPAASHTYTRVGTYTVRATVTDDKGATASAAQSVSALPGVKVSTPANGATVGMTVRVAATAASAQPITSMRIYLDGRSVYVTSAAQLDTYLRLPRGTRLLEVKAWDSGGAAYSSGVIRVTVR